MAKKTPQRLIWTDVVRALAIFLVILVHSIGSSTNDFLSFPLASSIAATCVPLFVLISGSLLLGKQETYRQFYRKRLVRLMLPWVTWTVIYFLISYLQRPVSELSQIAGLLSATFTSFWFLPMILALYIITPALRILIANAKPKEIAFLVILWFLAISVLPFYKNSMAFPLSVDNGLVRQTFSYLGFYLAGFLLTQIKLPSKKYLFLLLIAGMTSSIAFYYFRVLNNLQNPHVALDYIAPGTILASISLFTLIKVFENQLQTVNIKAKSVITSLSQAALGTYFVHGLVSQYFEKVFGFSYKFNIPYATAFLNAFILFTISYLIIFSFSKIPYMKKFIT